MLTEACKNLLKVFGEDALADGTCRRWFEKFESNDFDWGDGAIIFDRRQLLLSKILF